MDREEVVVSLDVFKAAEHSTNLYGVSGFSWQK